MKLTEIISLPNVYDAKTQMPLFSADVFADLVREDIAIAIERAFCVLNASKIEFTAVDNTNHDFTILDRIKVFPVDVEAYADKIIDFLLFCFEVDRFPREIEMTVYTAK